MRATASARKHRAFAPIKQVAKPGRHVGDGADYKLHRIDGQGERFREKRRSVLAKKTKVAAAIGLPTKPEATSNPAFSHSLEGCRVSVLDSKTGLPLPGHARL